ncbi:MAG: restriction endonuclease subunit S [Sterolibacterium sp.]|jgi:type I restriction enzyme S subunit
MNDRPLMPNPDWAKLPLFDRKGWKRVRFGDVVENLNETERDPAAAGIERFIAMEHLEPGSLHIREWGNVADGTTFNRRCRPGQVLFGKRRAYQRKVAVAEFDAVVSGDIYVFAPKGNRLLPELLPFLCTSEQFFNFAVETSAGSLSPRTNWSSLAGFEFDLPPLAQQRRIAEMLRAVNEVDSSYCRTVNAAKEAANRTVDSISSYSNTSCVPLKDLIVSGPQNGLYRPGTDYGSGKAILRIDSFYDGCIRKDIELKRVMVEPEIAERYSLEVDDVLINRVNSIEFVGKCALVGSLEEQTLFESNIMRMRVDAERIDPRLMIRWMCRETFRKHIIGRAKQAVNQASVNQDDLRSAPIPVPPMAVQAVILKSILKLEAAASAAAQARRNCEALRRTILDGILPIS